MSRKLSGGEAVRDHQEGRAEKESDHPGEDQTGAMQSQVRSIRTVQKTLKSNRMKDVLVDTQRQLPTMQKVQHTKVVNPVKISQMQYIDEIVRNPSDRAEAGADDAEDAERSRRKHPDTLCVNRPSPQESQCRAQRRLTMNSREQHPRKRCQKT